MLLSILPTISVRGRVERMGDALRASSERRTCDLLAISVERMGTHCVRVVSAYRLHGMHSMPWLVSGRSGCARGWVWHPLACQPCQAGPECARFGQDGLEWARLGQDGPDQARMGSKC